LTERLYYNDSYLRKFDARVLACVPAGQHWQVTLDRTAFYPTSGGQPFDTGKLGNARVLEVMEDESERVVHVLDQPLQVETVQGSVDWPRRFDHMQQHTGQHILSAAFVELSNFPTVSFHLGRDMCTIDLPQMPTPVEMEAAERRANAVVFENRSVDVLYGTAAELARLGVRKAVEREGVLRAVAIRDFDRQPCGGTHVARTGEVGIILLRGVEKQKHNGRIEFVCGERARRAARADLATLHEAAGLCSCRAAEVPAGIARALGERQEAHKRAQDALEKLARLEAESLLREAGSALPRRVVNVWDDADAAYLRLVATQLARHPQVSAYLASRAAGHVVFAQTPGGPADMNRLLREALRPFGGKGGGTRDFAQGSLPRPEEAVALLGSLPNAFAS
jgi:alanyl-tRNA synthetase